MLTYLHAPRRAVLDAFREDPDVLVGPESRTGWTVAWISEVEDVEHVERTVVVDYDEVENRVDLWVRGADADGAWCWEPDDVEAEGVSAAEEIGADPVAVPARRNAALALHQILSDSSPAESPLITLLVGRPSADELVDAFREISDLPDPDPPTPARAVVITRASAAATRLTGSMAATGLGDIALADLGDGWTALVPEESPEHGDLLAAAVGAMLRAQGLRARRKRALLLWRGQDGACGLELYRGEDLIAARSWGTGWEQPFCADHETHDASADELQILSSATDLPRLRSVLRNNDPSGDPLADLVEILSLPPTALALLDQRASAPTAEALDPVGPWGFVRGLLTGRGAPPLAPRSLLLLYALVCGISALLLGLLCATAIAVIATDGAFVDQPGVTTEDWAFLVVSGVGALGLGLTAVLTARMARQAE